ncbi:MAG: glucose-6-phosphate dehydrogenase [Candidatus Yonathbacteria bacterium CG_4_10_14_3_um_filter_47_65]|uniref:Glucose-6-phosphate 1-dehydrogenase n=2 Tax=Parcubacteria group TaxID=1794811 RepID=A0A2M8D6Z1_9BACT|nr:MAG: glucose-6-phosphate dehydrogenase [Candidatus Nomurabacteria bacterium CG1_02_47_685]PIP03226.1 MAG: glucose-6-phosphate dehydrogenase [Candidatus Yonathbacteria bacterium CG23_combo_of_CG06-09_8_20_14_all_46_18]PIQ33085.1 MAG: glucose-6-phosphate dehydrogenase [Candidatus Yonathbacteria bacterium CG17_big_fil_post_rev_8_21_14_2_50_46_19]PIX56649.1 MAG: glucose-6-phosphate dehydrogenase [Candidatus Yonathbacteria bacterium CG_4_10_14_3_um_filter_47_65]PIY57795.1 MAG: glucose-6-phosphate
MQKNNNVPTLITLFGGTGDLSQKKLLPAFFNLYRGGYLPDSFKILGVARKQLSDDEYRGFVARSVCADDDGKCDREAVDSFLGHILYQSGDTGSPESYKILSERLIAEETAIGQCANKLFYVAMSPKFYDTLLRNLADSGLTIPCSNETGWTRILIEKPFGDDTKTAQALDELLGLLFSEEQIFRIDHYLGKETIQNILTFRFSNAIFEPVWDSGHIDRVEIRLLEKDGVGERGGFYDGVGALRDVGQNHILQMLALIAMDNPTIMNAESIRRKRVEVFEKLHHMAPDELERSAIRGQYKGYREETNVDPSSKTETYFKIRAFLHGNRWDGVPFILESGKGLGEKKTEINIYFKRTKNCLCSPGSERHHENILTFRIQPDEGISILFWSKKAGLTSELEPNKLSFDYQTNDEDDGKTITTAYDRILHDAIVGDQTLFTSTQEVLASWKFITPIVDGWKDTEPYSYKRGSNGPESVH